jgi:glycosyltransferase involved in cell wall biosynthesis
VSLNSYWTNGKGMSGGDQMAIQIIKRIGGHFNQVLWFTNQYGAIAIKNEIPDAGIFQTTILADKLPIGLGYMIRTIQATVRLLSNKYDVIYSGSDFFPDVIPAYICKLFNPNIRWVQCIFHIYPDYRIRPGNYYVNWILSSLQKISIHMSKRADSVVNINEEVKGYLIKRGFNKKNIAIITPGVDYNYISKIALEANITAKFDAIFLGRLNPSKGIFDLVDIWTLVTKSIPNAKLGIIGSGSDRNREKLFRQISEKNLSSKCIELLGYLNSKDIYKLIAKSKVLVFPSHEEGFGIAIVESFACKTPVAAWDLSIYSNLFDDKVIVAPIGDKNAFSKNVINLVNSPDEAREDLGQVSKRYDWSNISLEMLNLLKA